MADFILFAWIEVRGNKHAAIAAAMPADPNTPIQQTEWHEKLVNSDAEATRAVLVVAKAVVLSIRQRGGKVLKLELRGSAPPPELIDFFASRRSSSGVGAAKDC